MPPKSKPTKINKLQEIQDDENNAYLSDNEEEIVTPQNKVKQQPKRKYRKKRKTQTKSNKNKTSKTKKQKLTVTENNNDQQILTPDNKIKKLMSIDKRLQNINSNNNSHNHNSENEESNMRLMNTPRDYSMLKFVPKSTNTKRNKKCKKRKLTKINIPQLLLNRIKQYQQSSYNRNNNSHYHNNNFISGYNSDNEDDIPTSYQPKQHTRMTGILYTSITKNGETYSKGKYLINNSDNPFRTKGTIKNGLITEINIPRT